MSNSTKPAQMGILTMTTDDLAAAIDAAVARAAGHEGPMGARKNAALNAAAAAIAGPRTNWGGLKAKPSFTTDGARSAAQMPSAPSNTHQADARKADTEGPRMPELVAFPEFGVTVSDLPIEARIRASLLELGDACDGLIFTYTSDKWSDGRITFGKGVLSLDPEPGIRQVKDLPQKKEILAVASDIEEMMNGFDDVIDWINEEFDIHEGWTTLEIIVSAAGILVCNAYANFAFERIPKRDSQSHNHDELPAMLFREMFGPMPDGWKLSKKDKKQYGRPVNDPFFVWVASQHEPPALSASQTLRAAGIETLKAQNPKMHGALMQAVSALVEGKSASIKQDDAMDIVRL